MTKSSRRANKLQGHPRWVSSKEKCEECGGVLVQTGQTAFVCTECGLTQHRYSENKRVRLKNKRK